MQNIQKTDIAFLAAKILIIFLFIINTVEVRSQFKDATKLEQIRNIESILKKDLTKTKWWWNSWLYAYSGATVAQGVICLTTDEKELRQDMALGTVTTVLGVVGQFISPLKPGKELSVLSKIDESSLLSQDEKLKTAEKLLAEVANREKNARGWKNHILPTAVNLAGGLVTWLGFKRTAKDGLINFAMSTTISEVQIWTQPFFAKRKYDKYKSQILQTSDAKAYRLKSHCEFVAMANGFSLRVIF